jgi:hypothetical protein
MGYVGVRDRFSILPVQPVMTRRADLASESSRFETLEHGGQAD